MTILPAAHVLLSPIGTLCVALTLVFGGCGARSEEGGGFTDDKGSSAPESTDGAEFYMSCGMCGGDPAELELWRSDFSSGFLGENETCSYAPSMLVDADPKTGWAEGAEGDGIGAQVVVPKLFEPGRPVTIWGGYGKSPDLFAANGRPRKVRVTVLRLRAAVPDAHDATGCSQDAYVEPAPVASQVVALRDFNGYQELPLPEFRVERYLEYPREWLMMDGTERQLHEQLVEEGRAAPFRREPTEYAYMLKLTLLSVYPGTRYEDTVISEIGDSPPDRSADP